MLGSKAKLTLRLQTFLIPILALSQGALSVKKVLPGFMKDVSPRLRTFPHGQTFLYVSLATPHGQIDTSGFPQGEYERVAVLVNVHESVLTAGSVYAVGSETQELSSN